MISGCEENQQLSVREHVFITQCMLFHYILEEILTCNVKIQNNRTEIPNNNNHQIISSCISDRHWARWPSHSIWVNLKNRKHTNFNNNNNNNTHKKQSSNIKPLKRKQDRLRFAKLHKQGCFSLAQPALLETKEDFWLMISYWSLNVFQNAFWE